MIKNFKILLDQPPGSTYFSGMEVTGMLVVEVDEPKNYNSISISLTGKGQVRWINPGETTGRNGGPFGPVGEGSIYMSTYYAETRTISRTYAASESYVDLKNVVWSKEQSIDGRLAAGEHHYQFRFLLPQNIPSSFDVHDSYSFGWIHYDIEAVIDSRFTHRIEVQVAETVRVSADSLRLPFRLEKQKTVCCFYCQSAPIVTTVEVPRTGYCVGEEIPFQVTVENGCSKPVRVTAVLQDRIIYTAQSSHRDSGGSRHGSLRSDPIEPHSTTVWVPEVEGMKIPITTPTTLNTSIIQRSFYLHFTTHIPNVCSNPTLSVPLTIGNVPYNQDPPTGGATAPLEPPIPFLPSLPQTTPELTSFDPPSYQDDPPSYQDAVTKY